MWHRYLILGPLHREFILPLQGRPYVDRPGGPALYAAAGLAAWRPQDRIALVSRVGRDFPEAWLQELAALGLDVRGVHRVDAVADTRQAWIYDEQGRPLLEGWVRRFRERGFPFPKDLLRPLPPQPRGLQTRPSPLTLRAADIPMEVLAEARFAHLAPLDYLTHHLLPAHLRQEGIRTIGLELEGPYMAAGYRSRVQELVAALTVVYVHEDRLRHLFGGLREDLWAMAQEVASWHVQVVVILRGDWTLWVYDAAAARRWVFPPYPHLRFKDPTGAASAMAGGFLWGWSQTEDPREAGLYAAATLSVALETTGPLALLDTLPGFLEQRRNTLAEYVYRV